MAKRSSKFLNGTLSTICNTDTEGKHAWIFIEDGKKGWDAIHAVKDGDVLRVFNDAARKKKTWEGRIDLEYDSHKKKLPAIPGLSQTYTFQQILGQGVHGIQKCADPEAWVKMFFEEKPAQLVPKTLKPQPSKPLKGK